MDSSRHGWHSERTRSATSVFQIIRVVGGFQSGSTLALPPTNPHSENGTTHAEGEAARSKCQQEALFFGNSKPSFIKYSRIHEDIAHAIAAFKPTSFAEGRSKLPGKYNRASTATSYPPMAFLRPVCDPEPGGAPVLSPRRVLFGRK